MHNLYLINYNNYYNRLFKKLNTLQDYLLADPDYFSVNSVNFISFDEVDAEAVINLTDIDNLNNYNYLISQEADSTNFERWFITKIEKVRGYQYKIILRRDLIADTWDSLKTSPMLINKGYTQINSPYFFNKENIDVNSIPTNQTYLKDETGVSWLVAYLPKTTQTIKDDDGNVNAWYDKSVEFSTAKPIADMNFETLDDVRYVTNNGKEIIGGTDLGNTRPTLAYYIKSTTYEVYSISLDLLAGTVISEDVFTLSSQVNYLETNS